MITPNNSVYDCPDGCQCVQCRPEEKEDTIEIWLNEKAVYMVVNHQIVEYDEGIRAVRAYKGW